LEHYQNGQYGDAEKLAISITEQFPEHQFSWKALGALLGQKGMKAEALNANQKAVQLVPQDAEAHNNLGATLQDLGRLEEAEACCRQAIALKSDFAEAHINLGNTLQALDRLEEAAPSYRQAIALKSDRPEAHNNLGITLQALAKLEEAEASYRQAIAMKPDYAEAHNNLGNTLQELGRLEEAEASCRQAITLKSDFVEPLNNLGNLLRELGRLREAEESYRQAIALKFDYALAHFNLGKALYIKGCKDLAIESIEKAIDIDPKSKEFRILLIVMKSRKSREESEVAVGDTGDIAASKGLTSNPLILNRVVEAELIANLYEMSSRELDKTRDARYGSGTCSPDFNLFEDDRAIIKAVAEGLTKTMMEAVKSEIFIEDSFFNILGAGGGTTPHTHINSLDKEMGLNLRNQKYSLVYYLSVGDQNCSDPGILKLYDPVEDILPREGMITIIPADRSHSAVYGGETDRVMIGVNFYSL
jgi:Flp pilus assembly protein TadD